MPYKHKEDRNEAMRRYRERQKEERVEAGERHQQNICRILEDLGFLRPSFSDLVRLCQEDFVIDGENVRFKETGKLVDKPDVFLGLNVLILVDTPVFEPKDRSSSEKG